MKRHLDLRTGRPVWYAYRMPPVPTETLVRDCEADVVVVGMGITGSMIAEALSAEGQSVIAIDRRGPLRGSTSATTALVQFEIDQPITKLALIAGKEKAERAWIRSRLAVEGLRARIQDIGIECGLAERRSLYLAGNVLRGSSLRSEADARRSAGLDATYLTRSELGSRYGIDRENAIECHGNLALDPRRLTAGLWRACLSRKARAFAPVEAVSFSHSADHVEVGTAAGPVIRAGVCVLATGYELAVGVPGNGHRVISTYAIATKPQPTKLWPTQAFVWEASDPYLYIRTTHDGRVICGGEDEEFEDEARRDALISRKAATIAGKLKALFPALDATPDYTWAGAFGSTGSGLPIIATVPGKPRLFAAMGYGGNGITWSRIAAEQITAAVTGREDRDTDLFGFPLSSRL
jgi:glycine/D-amino acid oxidase-like deaminating enzyme